MDQTLPQDHPNICLRTLLISQNQRQRKLPRKCFQVPPMSKKRSWTKDQKPTTVDDMDREFLWTMNSIQKAITDSEVVTKPRMSEEDDDDRHYCLSLVGQLKALEPQFKTMAKMQVMKVFNDIAWMRATQQQQLFSGKRFKIFAWPATFTYSKYQHLHSVPGPTLPATTTSTATYNFCKLSSGTQRFRSWTRESGWSEPSWTALAITSECPFRWTQQSYGYCISNWMCCRVF